MRNLFYLIKSIPFIQTAFNYYFDIKNREKEVCYGNENPNNFFYVIGLPDFACGLCMGHRTKRFFYWSVKMGGRL